MPCYKCNNGKYKYGERGRCQFDTKAACEAAERAIYAREGNKKETKSMQGCTDCGPQCDCPHCKKRQ